MPRRGDITYWYVKGDFVDKCRVVVREDGGDNGGKVGVESMV